METTQLRNPFPLDLRYGWCRWRAAHLLFITIHALPLTVSPFCVILTPFPHVAAHIMNATWRRPIWKQADDRCSDPVLLLAS